MDIFDDLSNLGDKLEKVLTQVVILVDAITILIYASRSYVKRQYKRELDEELKNNKKAK